MRTLLTLACLGLAIQPLAAQNSPNPLVAPTPVGSGALGTPAVVEASYSVVKAVPEDARRVRLNIHFDNKSTAIRPGTVRVIVRDPQGVACHESSAPFELKPGDGNIFSTDAVLQGDRDYTVDYTFTGRDGQSATGSFVWRTEPVNFFYAFTTPHRMTVALPDSSDKTLLDAEDGKLTVSWTYDNLDFYPYDSMREIKANWRIEIVPQLNGRPFGHSTWTRAMGWLPVLENRYERDGVSVLLEAAGGEKAGIIRVTACNSTDQPQQVRLPVVCPKNFKGYNPGWIDPTLPTDHLLAGWDAPADKVVVLGLGADAYPLDPVMNTQVNMEWTVAPGQTRTGWLIRPYDSYVRNGDVEKLRATDWAAEYEKAVGVWEELLARASRVIVPDQRVVNAYYAGLSDIFIMREPVGRGYIAIVPGTNGYRTGPNAFESSIATIALDQAGLHDEAESGYRVNWDLQTPEGDWTEPGGWGHLMWAGAGYKAWSLMEHFAHTRDTAFLKRRYPQLLANSRWQHEQRKKTKILQPDGTRPLTWGLMPRGMGDGGLRNDGSHYGIYYTHNIWPVYADSLAYRAALILDKTDDARELKRIYDEARGDLLTAMELGAVTDSAGNRYLTSIPGKATGTGSCWGLLASVYPTGLLPARDPLMENTMNHYKKRESPGGLPVHTGWMADGMWVAITLNDFGQVHLMRDEPDQANAYLYAVLNHATPFYSWCEERGQFPGAKQISGDLQHLWTPEAVVRFMRDMLVMEQDNVLHLGRGIARGWLGSGEEVGIERASTRFGDLSYRMRYDKKKGAIVGRIDFPIDGAPVQTVVHCLLPDGMKVVKCSAGVPLRDGSGFRIAAGRAAVDFVAKVK